jgi:lipid-binding SYLF domain-containing protein
MGRGDQQPTLKITGGKIMSRYVRIGATAFMLAMTATTLMSPPPAMAASAAEIDRDADVALTNLLDSVPAARALGAQAKGILIFPSIVKGGFIVGGQFGEGALRKGGKTVGYYNTVAASYGLQAGVQKFGYALFLMTDSALNYLEKSDGWEIGVGPSIVVVDVGTAKALTTTTAKDAIYAFFFGQKGLMAGLGLQGSKISRIYP